MIYIYAITSNDFDDYAINGVFDDFDKAFRVGSITAKEDDHNLYRIVKFKANIIDDGEVVFEFSDY